MKSEPLMVIMNQKEINVICSIPSENVITTFKISSNKIVEFVEKFMRSFSDKNFSASWTCDTVNLKILDHGFSIKNKPILRKCTELYNDLLEQINTNPNLDLCHNMKNTNEF